MKIAIDFDGTIVENKYPHIGDPMLFSFETMKALIAKKHQLILWTYRNGKELAEAVEYCKSKGVEFYAVNYSYPEEEQYYIKEPQNVSRKIDADVFIDDRNIGGFIGWSSIWQMLHPESGDLDIQFVDKDAHYNSFKKSFFSSLFKKNKR